MDNGQVFIPDYIQDITTLSKNHPNIVVIMIDGFTNPLFGDVLEMDPSLKGEFSGFTWYSNTLAMGDNTFLGNSVIHGGLSLSPYESNKKENKIISILEEIRKGYIPLLSSLTRENYEIDLINMQYTNCDMLSILHKDINTCTHYEDSEDDLDLYYFNKYQEKFPQFIAKDIKNNEKVNYNLSSIGLYYSLFYSLRGYIYNNGNWIDFFTDSFGNSLNYSHYAFLTSFIDLLNFQNTEHGVYKYINSGFTHADWNMFDSSCILRAEGENYYHGKNLNKVNQGQLYTTYCAIKEIQKLIQRLKKNNAWDNTMLIFVSDHSFKGDMKLAKLFQKEGRPISFDHYPGNPSSFLLIKEWGKSEKLKESKIFMTPADVPSIICQELGGCSGIEEDPRLTPNPRRKLIHTIGDWHPDRHPKNSYDLDEVWEVTGDMYQRENWRRIDDKK